MWTKVSWKHEDLTDRDFLRNREEYVSWFRVLRTPFHFCSNFGCTSSLLVFVARQQARLSEKRFQNLLYIHVCRSGVDWSEVPKFQSTVSQLQFFHV